MQSIVSIQDTHNVCRHVAAGKAALGDDIETEATKDMDQ